MENLVTNLVRQLEERAKKSGPWSRQQATGRLASGMRRWHCQLRLEVWSGWREEPTHGVGIFLAGDLPQLQERTFLSGMHSSQFGNSSGIVKSNHSLWIWQEEIRHKQPPESWRRGGGRENL